MAITEHIVNQTPYYRIYRAWGRNEHQEYVRIKRSKAVAYKKALIIDERLATGQKAYFFNLALSPEYHIRDDGRVRGLRRIIVKKSDRADAEVFELRINIPWQENKINRTTISIPIHGLQGAFDKCVDLIAEWYDFTPNSDVIKAIRETFKVYEGGGDTSNSAAEKNSSDTLLSDVSEWF